MIKLFFKRNWPSLVIVCAWAILTGLSKIEVNILWVKNINIWANAIILELFLFQIMSLITIKIRSTYWQTLINLTLTLLIGESIKYNFNYVDISILNIISVLFFVLLLIYYTYYGFRKGIDKGLKETKFFQDKLISDVQNMNNETFNQFKKEIRRSINFMKKHSFSASLIKDNSIDELEKTIFEYNSMRKLK